MRKLIVGLALLVVSCAGPETDVEVLLPRSFALSSLDDAFKPYLRATIEVEGLLGETALALDVSSNRLTGRFELPDRGEVTAPLEIRILGRYAESRPEVLLARLREEVTLDTTGENRPALQSGFAMDGEPIFDVNRNGIANFTDLELGHDPAPPLPFVGAVPSSLQLTASVLAAGDSRQIVAVENLTNHAVDLRALVSDAPGVYLSEVSGLTATTSGPVARSLGRDTPLVLSPFSARFLAVSFAPPNSFFLTGAVILKATDPESNVNQSRVVTLVGNADGRPQPVPSTYAPPADAPSVAGLSSPVVLYPIEALFSGFPIANVDPARRTSLRYTGNRLGEFGADAVYYLEIPPRYRFYSWITGLTQDVDLVVVPLAADGSPELGRAVYDRSSGIGPEAVQLDPTDTPRAHLLLLGVQAPALSEAERRELTDLPFQLTAHLVTGPDFDPVAPVEPRAGELEGGEVVTVRGSGFAPNVRVFLGNTEARVTAVDNDGREITIVAPPRQPAIGVQRVGVRVQNPSEVGETTQEMLLPQGYAYLPSSPRVTSIEPAVATAGGGTELHIRGEAFTGDRDAPEVLVGGVACPAVTRVSDTELLARAPALSPGSYDLEVVVVFDVPGGGSKRVTVQDAVAVQPAELPAPSISSVCDRALGDGEDCGALPAVSESQRPRLYVQGTGFVTGATVRIGTETAVLTTVVNDALVEVEPPGNPVGVLSLSLFNPDGQSATLVAAVAYVENCELTLEGCPFCGNGRIDVGEDCEVGDLDGASCQSLGYASGALLCGSGCRFDVSQCERCGNGRLDDIEEQCDGETPQGLGGRICSDFGFSSGQLGCTSGCTLDFSGCRLCGNSLAEGALGEVGAEVCDRSDLRGASCQSRGFFAGALACQVDCSGFDTSGCTDCGNGFVESSEQCDGSNLDGASCQSLIGRGGDLACSDFCGFDISGCNTCGDGIIQTGLEDCDGTDLAGVECTDFGYSGGVLTCSDDNCRYHFVGCYICGNGRRDPSEVCEGPDLGGKECSDFQFLTGTLGCTGACALDFSGCSRCGNGRCDPEESYTAATVDEGQCRNDCTITTCGNDSCEPAQGEQESTCPADCPWAQPYTVGLVQGTGLSGPIGGPVGGALEVEVIDANTTPVPGLSVTFEPAPGGHAAPYVVTTNADGRALSVPTLGLNVGLQTFTITARDYEGQVVGAPIQVELQANDVAAGTIFPIVNRAGIAGSMVPVTAAASATRLNNPARIAVGPQGSPVADHLFIADTNNHRVLRMEPTGRLSVFAGGHGAGYAGDGGPAVDASVGLPTEVEVGPDGSVYVYQTDTAVGIRKIDPTGRITTIVGQGTGASCTSGESDSPLATNLYLSDLTVAKDGTLTWVEEPCRMVRQYREGGLVQRIYEPGSAATGATNYYYGVDHDDSGALILGGWDASGARYNTYTVVREVDGVLRSIAGKLAGEAAVYESAAIGSATFANDPRGILYETGGTILVVEAGPGANTYPLWRIELDGYQSLVGGGVAAPPEFDYRHISTQPLSGALSLARDSQGNVFIQSRTANAVFMIRAFENDQRPSFALDVADATPTTVNNMSPDPTIVTVLVDGAALRGSLDALITPLSPGVYSSVAAGRTLPGGTINTNLWAGRAPGSYELSVTVSNIEGVAAVASVVVTAAPLVSGEVTPVINSLGQIGNPAAGPASQTLLYSPLMVDSDVDGTVFVSDYGARQVVAISAAGETSILAGTGANDNSGYGGPARLASFSELRGVARGSRTLFVSSRTQVLGIDLDATPEPVIAVVAGDGSNGCGFRDSEGNVRYGVQGIAAQAQFSFLNEVAVDPSTAGVLYVADGLYPVNGGCRTVTRIDGPALAQATRWFSGRDTGCNNGAPYYYLTGGLAVSASGEVYFGASDTGSCSSERGVTTPDVVYRLVSRDPNVYERVLGGGDTLLPDGISADDAQIGPVRAMAFAADGSLYVTDTTNNAILRVENPGVADPAQRTVTTVIGTGTSLETLAPVAAADATVLRPVGISFGPNGELLFVDGDRGMVRALEP